MQDVIRSLDPLSATVLAVWLVAAAWPLLHAAFWKGGSRE